MKHLFKIIYMTLFRLKRRDFKCEDDVEFGNTCEFEGQNLLSRGSYLRNVYMGYGSYIGNDCFLRSTRIGKYTCIGPNVTIAIGRHPTKDFVSIHPAFYSLKSPTVPSYVKKEKFKEISYPAGTVKRYCVEIGNDVWVGASSTIVDGITIGDGAIIASGSIVTKDVEPYSIVGGVPAKEIRKRFPQKDIENLMKIRWWEKNPEYISEHADDFESIEKFYKSFGIMEC